jgi:predicted RNase H-like HicB family nuclease
MPIRLRVERLSARVFLATSPDVPGLVAQGRTVTEAVDAGRDVARKLVESCLEHGDPLPRAFSSRQPRTMSLTTIVIVPAR